MKKKIITMVLLLTLVLIGCGSKKNNVNETGTQNQQMVSTENVGNQGLDEEPTLESEPEQTEVTHEYKLYDADPRWAELPENAWAVQIDDLFIITGIRLGDFFEQMETSEEEYTYDFDKSELVAGNTRIDFDVLKDGQVWFRLYASNVNKTAVKAEDTVILYAEIKGFGKYNGEYEFNDEYEISDITKETPAYYARVFDGIAVSEILEMTYEEISAYEMELLKTYLYEDFYKESISEGRMTVDSDWHPLHMENFYTVNDEIYRINFGMYTGFEVDLETNKVVRMYYHW